MLNKSKGHRNQVDVHDKRIEECFV